MIIYGRPAFGSVIGFRLRISYYYFPAAKKAESTAMILFKRINEHRRCRRRRRRVCDSSYGRGRSSRDMTPHVKSHQAGNAARGTLNQIYVSPFKLLNGPVGRRVVM